MKYFEGVWQKNKCGGISYLYLKKKKKKIVYKENKKFLKFQLKGVIGGIRRIVGELEFL